MSNDLLKYAEKMANPAIVVQSVFNLTKEEWASIYKTIGIVTKKISEKIMPVSTTFIDLLDNKGKCPGNYGKEHELAPSSKLDTSIKPECYMCVHCLEKFKMATSTDKTFFPEEKKN